MAEDAPLLPIVRHDDDDASVGNHPHRRKRVVAAAVAVLLTVAIACAGVGATPRTTGGGGRGGWSLDARLGARPHVDDSGPLVSIVATTYNVEGYVVAALKSALNQTYGNIELIVVDDHSTDGRDKAHPSAFSDVFSSGAKRQIFGVIQHPGPRPPSPSSPWGRGRGVVPLLPRNIPRLFLHPTSIRPVSRPCDALLFHFLGNGGPRVEEIQSLLTSRANTNN